MAIRFEVTGENVTEFAANFRAVIGAFIPLINAGAQPPVPPSGGPGPLPEPEQPGGHVEEDKPKAEAKPPKAGKKKDEPKQVDLEEKIAETKSVEIEDVRATLKALGEKKGHDEVFKLLDKYGSKNASGVAAEKRAELVAEANTAVEG